MFAPRLLFAKRILAVAAAVIASQAPVMQGANLALLHRYSFTTNANDSIGTANGTLPNGGTFSGGQLSFSSATQQYLSLPGGIIDSNYQAVTIDMWATIQTGLPTFCYLYCIGNTDAGGLGENYIFLNPQFARVTISAVDPGYNGEQGGNFATLAGASNLHITSVFDCPNGVISIYTNGVLSASFTGTTDPLSVVGTQFTYIGRSLYNDSFFNWSINELRFYNGALNGSQIAASDLAGPDNTNLSLGTVTNLQLQVPTNQLALGSTEPATVYAQTTAATNLVNFTALCIYSSGNSNVLRVDANGVITAFGPGTAAITAQFSNVSSAPVTITVTPSPAASLAHRYSFTSNANDSVGTANGTLQGNAVISNGAVVLDGVNSFVNLPGGLISSLQDVTFETWVTPAVGNAWGRVFDFGSNTGGAGGQGTGQTYAFLTTVAGSGGPLRFAYTTSGGPGEFPVLNGPLITNNLPYFFAAVYSPSANTSGLYVNGTLVASGTAPGPLSSISDVNDWLGKSQYNDPYFGGSIDEFRIWQTALTAAQIAADYSNGPNTVVIPPPTKVVVTNVPASSISANAGVLNGQVLSTGNQTPAVTVYYGPTDGGTNVGAWANSVALSAQPGAFSTLVSGLVTNTTYYFTAFAVNSAGGVWASPSLSFTTLATNPVATRVQVATYHYDNTRQGLNTNETLLTPANVNVANFGKLFSYPLDGYIYTEPLILTNVTIPGQGVHDVVYVASEHDTVYALDADNNTGTNGGVLWATNLGNYALSASATFGGRYTGGGYTDILPDVGITGTPVIDPLNGTLYVDAFTLENGNYIHRLHALDVTTGMERTNSPVVVTASVPGTGRDSSGGMMTFNPMQSNQRGALTLANGVVYLTYAGYADTDPYHGWVIGYNESNLTEVSAFCTTPNATTAAFGANAAEGGIWQGGNGLCVDSSNNLYFESGNGSFSQVTNGGDYADSLIKLSTTNGLSVADYFTPYNQLDLANADLDLGSCGPMLVPAEAASPGLPQLIVGVGKAGTFYLVNRTNMGKFNTGGNDSQIVQSVAGQLSQIWSSPVYFNHLIFMQASGSVMKSFTLNNGVLGTTPASATAIGVGQFNGGPVISANGTNNGIAWMINGAAFQSSGPDVLYAFNATNLSQMLYNSSQNLARDNPGGALKMTTPTVSGGKVYVGSEYALSVYGVQVFLDTPVIAPNGGAFTNSVQVSLTDGSPGVNIYYTLDGTAPTAGSTLYTGPFLLTSNAVVSAIATQPGAVNSGVAGASFVNTAALGNGTGLLGQYYTNTLPGNPFVGSPLVRTDAVVNFNWSTSPPFAGMASSNYTVKWTGSLQPQFNETYTLTTVSDDGVRLYVNGQLLINDWMDQPATSNSVSLPLVAQQLYTIEMDYYQHNSNAVAELEWSSPSTSLRVVPQTQLYPYTNPAPTVVLTGPSNNASYSGTASVTLSAEADAPYNPVSGVSFYANNTLLGVVSNAPYTLTATGLGTGSYALEAVAVDGSGLEGTSAVVNVTVGGGSGAPYGLTTNGTVPAFFNMPTTFAGSLPLLLSATGVFSNTPNMAPAGGLIPYVPNTPLWSDGALKTRYMAVPNNGGVMTPGEQIAFAPTGTWTFPSGTVFVKTFSLNTDVNNPAVVHRLETRLLVRDINGQVYGVTYKWRADNSDADLLTNSLTENIVITNGANTTLQPWYYPSPSDCLTCHAGVNNDYVLGVNSRQLNGNQTYPATGVTDNQLRTLNRLGLLNPAFDEGAISNYEKLSALTNLAMSLQERSRSYLDANCAQCHQPGGTGITFDARYDTALTNQNLINFPASESLGYDHARIIAPSDVWRSVIWDRVNIADATNVVKFQMPPLARNVIDTNAVAVLAGWINSLGSVPAEAPPVLTPDGGSFLGQVGVGLTAPDTSAVIYYTLDGSLPTTNSLKYTGLIELTNGAVTVSANAWAAGHTNSVAASALFVVQPLYFASAGITNQSFTLQLVGAAGSNYVLQATTNFTTWVPVATNTAVSNVFILQDINSGNFSRRFYRVLQQ